MHLFLNDRAFLGFNQEFSFVDEIAVAFFAKMGHDMFNTDGISFRNISNIRMPDVMAVDDHYQSASYSFELVSFSYKNTWNVSKHVTP